MQAIVGQLLGLAARLRDMVLDGACDGRAILALFHEIEFLADGARERFAPSPAVERLVARADSIWRECAARSGKVGIGCVAELALIVEALASHFARAPELVPERPRLFIGHGRTNDWRAVRDHLAELGVEGVEFQDGGSIGRPVALHIERLLVGCEGAVLVATAEIMDQDGKRWPRPNVVHELGLAQGLFGRERTFVLAERGIELPSNLAGIGIISFEAPYLIAGAFEALTKALRAREVIPGPEWRQEIVRAGRRR